MQRMDNKIDNCVKLLVSKFFLVYTQDTYNVFKMIKISC